MTKILAALAIFIALLAMLPGEHKQFSPLTTRAMPPTLIP